MREPTDSLLCQFSLAQAPAPDVVAALTRWCEASPLPMQLDRLAWSATTQEIYLYGHLPARTVLDSQDLKPVAALLAQQFPQATQPRVSRLQKVFDAAGHSRAEVPVFHYAVEMDPEEGWMPEISRWYDTEHMPGLAAVPGCIVAMRYLNHDHGPLSLACYDLMSESTLGSPPWLAVRGTAWSDITRPHFTNTKRTMMQVLA